MEKALAEAVAGTFGLGPVAVPPEYVARGAMGEIWRVVTTSGDWAVKELFEWASYPAVPGDVAVQRAARVAGIPLPDPVIADGAAVHHVNATGYRVYEWVDLDLPLSTPSSAARAEEAGSLLAKIHNLPLPVADLRVDDWYTSAPPAAEFRRLAEVASSEGRPWADDLHAAESVIQQLTSYITRHVSPIGLCHRDFDATNVLPRAGDGPLVVLDWENAGPLPQDEELAASLLAWSAAGGAVDARAAEAFVRGYQDTGGPARVDPARSFSTSAATALNFLRVMSEQALVDSKHRPFAEERLGQLLRRGLSDLASSIRSLVEDAAR